MWLTLPSPPLLSLPACHLLVCQYIHSDTNGQLLQFARNRTCIACRSFSAYWFLMHDFAIAFEICVDSLVGSVVRLPVFRSLLRTSILISLLLLLSLHTALCDRIFGFCLDNFLLLLGCVNVILCIAASGVFLVSLFY